MGSKARQSIKEWPEDERPREKVLRSGVSALSKSELLAILIGSGNAEESAVELMKKVLASCGDSIAELAKLSVDDLCQFKGIGPAKAITIIATITPTTASIPSSITSCRQKTTLATTKRQWRLWCAANLKLHDKLP